MTVDPVQGSHICVEDHAWMLRSRGIGMLARSSSAAPEQRHTPWTKTRLGSTPFPPSTWDTRRRTAKNWPPVNTSAAPKSGAKSRRIYIAAVICGEDRLVSDTSGPAEDTDADAPSRGCATRVWDSGPSAKLVLRGRRRRPCRSLGAGSQGCRGWRLCSGHTRRR